MGFMSRVCALLSEFWLVLCPKLVCARGRNGGLGGLGLGVWEGGALNPKP